MKISHFIPMVSVQLDLEQGDDAYEFICGESIFEDGGRYISMLERLENLKIENIDYNGHFGYHVWFMTQPENVEAAVGIMKEIITEYVSALKKGDSDCHIANQEAAARFVHGLIEDKINA